MDTDHSGIGPHVERPKVSAACLTAVHCTRYFHIPRRSVPCMSSNTINTYIIMCKRPLDKKGIDDATGGNIRRYCSMGVHHSCHWQQLLGAVWLRSQLLSLASSVVFSSLNELFEELTDGAEIVPTAVAEEKKCISRRL